MRTFITAVAMATGISLSLTPAAFAANYGGASVANPVASTPATSQTAGSTGSGSTDGSLDTQTVALTKTQTKSVQRRVDVPADGSLGTRTQKAIKRYQAKKALTLTGKPNIQTLRAMKLKIADKIEAKLTATAPPAATATQTVALPTPTTAAAAALAAAETQTGTPYVSGGTKPGGFDCSGLTVWAFAQAGITLPRTSFDQYKIGTAVPRDQIQAGDLVFFDSNGAGASHVGIAVSTTTAISATSHGVMEHDISAGYWAGHYVGARRVTDAPTAVAARAARN